MPTNLVTVTYVRRTVCGVVLVVSEVGVLCVAGCGSMLQHCGHVSHDQSLIQFHRGFDATWGNLVVQPFLGLVCPYAMGSQSEKPAESCQLGSEICVWAHVRTCSMQAPLTHCQTPPTHIQDKVLK